IIKDPDCKISALPLLTSEQIAELERMWEGPRAEPSAACLHDLVEQQVERTPDAVALTYRGVDLSYRELDRRANRVANYLQSQGVRPNSIVGVCIERSPEMIIALLGILKSGAAYLPLDPAYPNERRAYMIDDARAKVVLTAEQVRAID